MTRRYLIAIVIAIFILPFEKSFSQTNYRSEKKEEKKLSREYEKFIKALISGDSISAQKIEDRNIEIQPIEEKPFPVRNVPEYVFTLGIEQVKDSIIGLFNFKNQYNNKTLNAIFYHYTDEEDVMNISFNAETVNNRIFGKAYFENPNTSNDIYIHDFGTCWLSKFYFSQGRPLEYRTAFIVKLSAVDNKSTKISIVAEEPSVINGIVGFGVHGPIARETKVQSSSIEEYTLLLFIADKLGYRQLTPLKLPSEHKK